MLVRGSRRKLQYDAARALQPSLEQLQLPWLCPAFFERPQQRQSSRHSATASAIRRTSSPASGRPQSIPRSLPTPLSKSTSGRGFATPAAAVEIQDEYIPFESQAFPTSLPQRSPWQSQQSLSELLPFDPTNIHKIADDVAPAPRKFFFHKGGLGIGGDISDIHSILQAYLDVGQWDRASMTVRRLGEVYNTNDPELFQAHLTYIATMVSNIMVTGDPDLCRHLWRWFNEDVRAKGVKVNATIIRLLVQATLKENNSNPKKTMRNVRRYLHAAKREKILEDSVRELAQFITDEELRQIRFSSPEYFDSLSGEPITSAIEPIQIEEDTPAVRAQQQKGLGLIALRKSLSVFSDLTNSTTRGALQGNDSLAWRQERLEEDTISSSIDRWRADHEETMKRSGINTGLQGRYVGALMWKWHEALIPLIKEEVKKAKSLGDADVSRATKNGERAHYGPFLQYLPPEKLSAITILVALQAITRTGTMKGMPLATLVSQIGKAIQDESLAEVVKARNKQWMAQTMPAHQRLRTLSYRVRHEMKTPQGQAFPSNSPSGLSMSNMPDWSALIQGHVGVALASLLFQVARLEVPKDPQRPYNKEGKEQPAFTKNVEFIEGRKVGLIKLNDYLVKEVSREPLGSVIAKHLPMLTKPVPWTGFREGGFVKHPVTVVRTSKSFVQTKQYVELASKSGDMEQVYAALDVLGKTPWRINKEVFDIMLRVWNTGEAIANIPPAEPNLEYPPEPTDKEDVAARRLYAFKSKQVDNLRDGMHSNRCFQNFQLEVARAYLDETFYFPHNMDFRGRAYPIPPYLNHMGADHCRGLLKFGEGKQLGEMGLVWLRVHVANVFGFDKASISERRDFAIEHIDDIIDSASSPLDGRRWWLEAEDPWQCLAACIELKAALDLPDPTKHVSYLPIHQDGTCNGLQHYAALGGDSIGAKQVNLEPGDRPADIYTAVANSVTELIRQDAESGDELAKLLDGKIKRKVVKQTVMTNVYGVTFSGARLQVKDRLQELYPGLFKDSPQGASPAASYIARKIFVALSAMFNGAHDIQYWLGECASRVCDSLSPAQVELLENAAAGIDTGKQYKKRPSNSSDLEHEQARFKSSVIWTTPLKMPVVQPYRKSNSKWLKTNLQQISLSEPSVSDPVSKRKQLQAFPPNFIHSLDATHMFLSALKCEEQGLSFAAVHDSFWTHACNIDTMNLVLRDAFIRMHSEDIIGRLAAEFQARYSGYMYFASVRESSDIGKKIMKLRGSRKNPRGQQRVNELLLESRRQRLLASEDPAERAEGEAIVTPAKLFEELSKDEELATFEDLDGAIGEIKASESETLESTEVVVTEHGVQAAASIPEELPSKVVGNQKRKHKISRPVAKVLFWKKMSFPAVPKKGDFDVKRLKESKYFFS